MPRLGAALLTAIVLGLTVAASFAGDSTTPPGPAVGHQGAVRAPSAEAQSSPSGRVVTPRVSPDPSARERDRLLMLLLLMGTRHPLQGR